MLVNKDVLEAIFVIDIEEILELDPETLLDESMGWDSMAKVLLIAEISDKFDKTLDADDLETIQSLNELDALITKTASE
jgi:acyl carrier protein|tara:strand:+ start:205 stop:441 length:237 start_codon:yes stop_codon:yes gene_type:complete